MVFGRFLLNHGGTEARRDFLRLFFMGRWRLRLVVGKNWKIMVAIVRKGGMTACYDGYTG